MASFKKLSKSDVTFVPYYANKQWSLTYCPYPTSSEYLTIYNGTNLTGSFSSDGDPVTEGQYDRLVYSQINQLFYQKYTASLNTSSLANSIYYESASQQRPTQSYFIYNDSARLVENFPTGAMEGIRVLAINQGLYGDKVLPNHFRLSSSAYNITDDGYGNLYDGIVTGSQQSTNEVYAESGVRLYSPGYDIDGTGTNISWNTVAGGGSYTGTFWTNPVVANKTGRLNYTGLWSGKSLIYFGSGILTFNITASSNTTYYFGIGCDNYASLYLDNTLILTQVIPDAGSFGANYRYWHIYPVSVSSGSHVVKLIGDNIGIPDPSNPGSMGIEIYNNTSTQISASITSSPTGSSIPSGLNVVYSSKDHLTEGNFNNQYATHIGNLFYAHGLGIITNQDYQMMFPLPPIAKNDSGYFLTTDTPKTISASANDYARSGTLNTSSLAFSGSTSGPGYSWATGSNGTVVLTTTTDGTYTAWYTIGADIVGSCATQLRSNKAKVTAVVTSPTTTTSTTTTTTTSASLCNFQITETTTTNATNPAGNNGTATITFISASAPVSYSLNGAFQGVVTSSLLISNLSSSVSYTASFIDANSCTATSSFTLGESTFVFLADYMMLTYGFTDGLDLDTRTRIVTPDVGQVTQSYYVGYFCQNQWPSGSTNPYLIWGGDNQGTGSESVLVNFVSFSAAYPTASSVLIDMRAYWFNQTGSNPVDVTATLWKGGTPVYNSSSYVWTNPTATSSFNIDSVGKVITSKGLPIPGLSSGERVATLTYNLISGSGVFDNNDTTTPSV